MRARSWIALGWLAFACGGTAFSPSDDGSGGGGQTSGGSPASGGSETSGGSQNNGATAGAIGQAGRNVGGTGSGTAGKVGVGGKGVGGSTTTGGDVSAGGEAATAGNPALGGEAGNAGAGPEPIDKVCPVALPASGGGCVTGLGCSYGDDIRPSCRSHAACENGTWSLQLPKCPGIAACAPIVQGSACDAQSPACTIQGSIFCACTGCTGAGPCSTNTVWVCTSGSGGAGCPELIPNQGQTCSGSATCTYGSCSTGEKVSATCQNSTWTWKAQACPL